MAKNGSLAPVGQSGLHLEIDMQQQFDGFNTSFPSVVCILKQPIAQFRQQRSSIIVNHSGNVQQ